MRFILVPGNNSLSHVTKCLAIKEALVSRGHEAPIAVSRKSSLFLKEIGADHCILPDIQENDGSGFPSVEWFRRPECIVDCINAEVNLLQKIKPDRVLGVFRFTLKASAQIAGVPYDSLACGCMIPDSSETLGFFNGEQGIESQRTILEGFYSYAGVKTSAALTGLGLDSINDIRDALKGERTFLWDFPEFLPLPQKNDIVHVGPISWNRWNYDKINVPALSDREYPLAVIAFGTCMTACPAVVKRIARILLDIGYRVLLAAGGQCDLLKIMPQEPRLAVCSFAPLHKIFPYASLLVTHGGQMTVFEALNNEVPVLVMPFQPEQAHNGVCLERIGCGGRLVPPQPFQGNPKAYIDAFGRMNDGEIISIISGLVNNPDTKNRLAEIKEVIGQYRGAEKLATMLEGK